MKLPKDILIVVIGLLLVIFNVLFGTSACIYAFATLAHPKQNH
jgi:hypothetical protein